MKMYRGFKLLDEIERKEITILGGQNMVGRTGEWVNERVHIIYYKENKLVSFISVPVGHRRHNGSTQVEYIVCSCSSWPHLNTPKFVIVVVVVVESFLPRSKSKSSQSAVFHIAGITQRQVHCVLTLSISVTAAAAAAAVISHHHAAVLLLLLLLERFLDLCPLQASIPAGRRGRCCKHINIYIYTYRHRIDCYARLLWYIDIAAILKRFFFWIKINHYKYTSTFLVSIFKGLWSMRCTSAYRSACVCVCVCVHTQ